MYKTLLAATAASLLSLGTAQAATMVYATEVFNYVEGAGITQAARRNTANALGPADYVEGGVVKFLSLGLGGSAIFGFGVNFAASGAVIESTNGNRARHVETADVFGLMNLGDAGVLIGRITNAAAVAVLNFTGTYKYMKIVDTSPRVAGRDGFDIDAIRVAAVPLPAAGLLLIGALGGLAALRRRKARAA